MKSPLQNNAIDLEKELQWCTQIIDARFKMYFNKDVEAIDIVSIAPPNLEKIRFSICSNYSILRVDFCRTTLPYPNFIALYPSALVGYFLYQK